MNMKVFNRKELLMIVACFSGIGICYGLQYSFSIFFVEITGYFHSTKANASLIFSLTLLIYGLYAPFIGILTNKFGGRYIFKIGAFIILAGLLLSSFAKNIYQLYLTLGVISALGINSVGFVPVTIIITNNFKEKRGLAIGIATTGVGVGAIIIGSASRLLIECFNWKIALAILSVTSFTILLFVSNFLPLVPREKKFKIDFRFLREKDFWLIQGGMTCGALTVQTIMLHIVACFINKGASLKTSAFSILLIAFIGSLGKILWGFLADFFKPVTLYFFACSLILTSLYLLLRVKIPASFNSVMIFSLLFGMGYGAFAPLFPTLVFEKFKDDFGNIMGLLITGNGIGAFLGTYIAGYLYDLNGNYNTAIIMLMSVVALSMLFFAVAFKRKEV